MSDLTTTEDRTQRLATPHSLAAEEAYDAASSRPEGLSTDEAARRFESDGPNALPEAEQETWWQRLLRQFNDPMIYVLIAAGILTAILGQVIDTIVIFAVVLVNGLVGFVQEGKAADALDSIRNMLSPASEVKRGDSWTSIPSEELVVGDVVRLRAGDKVPADLRLVDASGLRIEESALTGESVASEKSTKAVEDDAGIGDRPGMAFSGTTVAAGQGIGVVTGTGADTEIGAITTMLGEVEEVQTPLTKAMAKFSSLLAIIAVIAAVVMMAVNWLLYRTDLVDLLMSAIGFAVAAIPEGLPAVMAITLALGVQKMAGRNAITRRMNSVETLGSVTTICSDKTGTLTRNEMTVRRIRTAAATYDVSGTGYAPNGEVSLDGDAVDPSDHDDLRTMAEVAAFANDADVVQDDDGAWSLQGEPTDGAITTFALKAKVDQNGKRVAAVPFDSEYKYMATLDDLDDEKVIHLKGAPDRLLDRCETQFGADGVSEPLDREFWESEIERLGSQGMRLLAGAVKSPDTSELALDTVDAGGFTFVGLYGMIDPPREESIEAVRLVQDAGITVRMITGDHAATATAIAKEIGIASGDTITGAELEAASDEELREIVKHTTVYARTSPEHKLRLVRALQANGEVVSMTGDGVNDAPSLKQADVGVAMGIKGTEATKDAADIVLADDNFATISSAVKMGRTIFDNLRKAIVFMLPTNGAQGLIIFVAMLLGWTLPITPLQVLWVNLITAVTLSLALSFEDSEPGIMRRKPRDPSAGLLDRASIIRIVYVSLLIGGISMAVFYWAQDQGMALELSRTLAVNTLVIAQVFYLFTARFSTVSALRKELFTTNPASWVCIAIMLVLQLIFVYAPFMHVAFGTTNVSAVSWLVPIAAGVIVFAVVELDKLVRRH